MKYALVKPLIKLKKGLNLLDYSIPGALSENLKIGQLVEIPFRNSSKFGIIFDIKNETQENIKIKDILKISNQNPIISENQIKFYKWFCDYNFSSLNFLNNIIPLPMKNKIKEKDEKFFIYKTPFKLKNINSSILENKQFIFKHNFFDEKLTLIKNTIDKNFKNKKITLIICPTKIHIEKILSSLLNFYTEKDYRIITGLTHLSKLKHNEIWNSIKNNKLRFIIGTKISIFYPMENTKTIIIDESENENLNQIDINPRFEFLPNVLELSKINNSQIIFTTYSPNAYLYNLAKEKQLKLLETKEKVNTEISVLDMSTKYFENYLHFFTEEEVKNNQKILFLLNKKGYSKNLKCRDCNFVFRCEKCNSVLSIKNEKLHCYNCEKSFDAPITCPNCNGAKFNNYGVGTEQFTKIIKNNFQNKKVITIDKDNYKNLKLTNQSDIVVATRIIIDYIKENEYDLIVIPFSHQFLNNNFDSNEDFFELIAKLISLKPKKIIVQCIGEQKIHEYIRNNNYKSMIEDELNMRKLLKYPPFENILKITIKDKDKSMLDKKTNELYDKIKLNIGNNVDLLEIVDKNTKVRSFYMKYILLKYKDESDISSIKKLLNEFDIIEKNYFKL
ncbi:MAG TPA: hypothetical protein PLD95_00420 [bacterium]|jgi:primosomal protein N'|nr:hypothetical protein [bacterium]HOG37918.1 hypothetical protein [bacterium]HQI02976.1 hypothetical protein [bacterium]